MIIKHRSPNKGERANQLRQREIDSGFTYGRHVFDGDSNSLSLIMARALRLTLAPSASVAWRTKDNRMVKFTNEQFLEFAAAADAYIESVYQQSWALKDESP